MKPAPFSYHRARSAEEAVSLLAGLGDDAKLLAGGQSLVAMMNFRLARPAALVDISRLAELRYVRPAGGGLRIGALALHRDLERLADPGLLAGFGMLPQAAGYIGHYAIRAAGTFGGSIAHADPAAELTAVLAALDGEVTARGPQGDRVISARELFVTYLTTSLEPRELLVEARFPAPPQGAGWSWMEVARRHGDFALAGVGTVLVLRRGTIADARIGLIGVGPTPVRAAEAERGLIGRPPSEALWEAAAEAVRGAVSPDGDIHASAEYRRHVAGVLAQRALRESLSRVQEAA